MTAPIDKLVLLDEYDFIKERCEELEGILVNWGSEKETQSTPKEVLSKQLGAMSEYLLVLTERIRLYEGLSAYID